MFIVSVLCLIVNLIGVYAFQHDHGLSHGGGHDHGHGGESSHSHSHSPGSGQSQIMEGVLLQIIADTLGSVGVIISSLLDPKYIVSHTHMIFAAAGVRQYYAIL